MAKPKSAEPLAHCCAIFLWSLGREIDDHHRNPNINDRDHLVGQLTNLTMEMMRDQNAVAVLCCAVRQGICYAFYIIITSVLVQTSS